MIAQSCAVGIADMMYKGIHSRGPGLASRPGDDEGYPYALFFLTYNIVGAVFLTNLFAGVVISSFNREHERLGKHFLHTDSQKTWITTKMLTLRVRPKIIAQRPKTKCRAIIYDVV